MRLVAAEAPAGSKLDGPARNLDVRVGADRRTRAIGHDCQAVTFCLRQRIAALLASIAAGRMAAGRLQVFDGA